MTSRKNKRHNKSCISLNYPPIHHRCCLLILPFQQLMPTKYGDSTAQKTYGKVTKPFFLPPKNESGLATRD